MSFRSHGTTLVLFGWMLGGFGLIHAEERTNAADITTAHFILHAEGLDPTETGLFLESAFAQMTNFFKAEPDRKLSFKVFAGRREYQAEIDQMRGLFAWGKLGSLREARGCYLRENATAYGYVHPGTYETRCHLISLLALQFADAVRPWGYVPSLSFCDHGLAQYFALHNWDGEVLRLGIVPPIAPEEYPRLALEFFRNRDRRQLQDIVDGKAGPDIPGAWGLVSFLISQHRDRFDDWRKGLNHGVDPSMAWQKQFGAVTPQFTVDLESWLESKAMPWKILSGDWQPWGEAIKGSAGGSESARAILTKTPRQLTVTLDWPSTNSTVGLIFGARSLDDYRVLQRGIGTEWKILHCQGGQVRIEERPVFPVGLQRDFVTIEPAQQATRLNVNGRAIEVKNAFGSVGVHAEGGPARFWCHWK